MHLINNSGLFSLFDRCGPSQTRHNPFAFLSTGFRFDGDGELGFTSRVVFGLTSSSSDDDESLELSESCYDLNKNKIRI